MAKTKQHKIFGPDGEKLEDEEFVGAKAPDTDPEISREPRRRVVRRARREHPRPRR
jgi:hypothetical protein